MSLKSKKMVLLPVFVLVFFTFFSIFGAVSAMADSAPVTPRNRLTDMINNGGVSNSHGGGHAFGVFEASSILSGIVDGSFSDTSNMTAADVTNAYSYFVDGVDVTDSSLNNTISDLGYRMILGMTGGSLSDLGSVLLDKDTVQQYRRMWLKSISTGQGNVNSSNVANFNRYTQNIGASNFFSANKLYTTSRASYILPEQWAYADNVIRTRFNSGMVNCYVYNNRSNALPDAQFNIYYDEGGYQINALIYDLNQSKFYYGVTPDGISVQNVQSLCSSFQTFTFTGLTNTWRINQIVTSTVDPLNNYFRSIGALFTNQYGSIQHSAYLDRDIIVANTALSGFNCSLFTRELLGDEYIYTPYVIDNGAPVQLTPSVSPTTAYYIDSNVEIPWEYILQVVSDGYTDLHDLYVQLAELVGLTSDSVIALTDEDMDFESGVVTGKGYAFGDYSSLGDLSIPSFTSEVEGNPISVLWNYGEDFLYYLGDVFHALTDGAPGIAYTFVGVLTLNLAGGILSKLLL